MGNAHTPAVVLGLSPTGLYVARELSASGVPLLGVDKEFSCAMVSRHFRRDNRVWHEPSSTNLLARLVDFAALHASKPVLIPTSDYYIEFVIRNYSQLAELFYLGKGYQFTADTLLNKLKFHELCSKHEIPTPGVWELADINDLAAVIDTLPFPCILKPSLIHLAKPFMRGKKVLIVNNREELLSVSESLPQESGSWLIQEIIPGPESEITVAAGYADTAMGGYDIFTARKLRQYPPGFGSASRVISSNCDETRDLTVRLARLAGIQGIFGSEFKRDPRDGKLKIIEVNPRPTLWFQLSHTAGKRLSTRAYSDMTGASLPPMIDQREGIVWQYLLKDWSSALFYRFKGTGFIFPPPDLTAGGHTRERCWPVFSFSDPLPALAELYVYGTKLIRRAF